MYVLNEKVRFSRKDYESAPNENSHSEKVNDGSLFHLRVKVKRINVNCRDTSRAGAQQEPHANGPQVRVIVKTCFKDKGRQQDSGYVMKDEGNLDFGFHSVLTIRVEIKDDGEEVGNLVPRFKQVAMAPQDWVLADCAEHHHGTRHSMMHSKNE